jgi:hypothetical protein
MGPYKAKGYEILNSEATVRQKSNINLNTDIAKCSVAEPEPQAVLSFWWRGMAIYMYQPRLKEIKWGPIRLKDTKFLIQKNSQK